MTNTYIKPHRMYLKCISLNTKKINKTMQVLEENLGKLLYILTVVGGGLSRFLWVKKLKADNYLTFFLITWTKTS